MTWRDTHRQVKSVGEVKLGTDLGPNGDARREDRSDGTYARYLFGGISDSLGSLVSDYGLTLKPGRLMEGIGALYVTSPKEGSTVDPSSIWAEKPFMTNVKLPLSQEKPSSVSSLGPDVLVLPDTEPCNISMVPVTVQFLHSKLTPGLLKPSISTQLRTHIERRVRDWSVESHTVHSWESRR